jgi:hypothetical protein
MLDRTTKIPAVGRATTGLSCEAYVLKNRALEKLPTAAYAKLNGSPAAVTVK